MSNKQHDKNTTKHGNKGKAKKGTSTSTKKVQVINRHHHHTHRNRHRPTSPTSSSRQSSASTNTTTTSTTPSPAASASGSFPMISSENALGSSNLSTSATGSNVVTISSGWGTSIPPLNSVNPTSNQTKQPQQTLMGAKMTTLNIPSISGQASQAQQQSTLAQIPTASASSQGSQPPPQPPTTTTITTSSTSTTIPDQVQEEYKLLLSPLFSAMTKITDNLFLTGVGGMTRENFRRNHIDFVINITTDAPLWEDSVESWRLPLEDDTSTNILAHLDIAADRIHEAITKRNAHVLVHCVAGVSRSATVVLAYLMKYKRMDLKTAFNHCYNLRPVVRPNNGFMVQLIDYENQLFNHTSVKMVEADVDGTVISVPSFFIEEHPKLVLLEVMRVRDQMSKQSNTTGGPTNVTTTMTTTNDESGGLQVNKR